jgi:steroid 5-alpha reductase family enzyme
MQLAMQLAIVGLALVAPLSSALLLGQGPCPRARRAPAAFSAGSGRPSALAAFSAGGRPSALAAFSAAGGRPSALASTGCAASSTALAASGLGVEDGGDDAAEAEAKKRKAKTQRLVKLAAFSAVTVAALAKDGPPLATLGRAAAACLTATLGGFVDSHNFVSYGYGASMALLAALVQGRSLPGAGSELAVLAYALYGAKVVLFQAARDVREDYVAKAIKPMKKAGGPPKPFFWLSVSALLSLFVFPVYYATSPVTILRPRLSYAGGAISLASLAAQTLADVQKYRHKAANGADAPMLATGLFAFSRHPNYLAEQTFQIGVFVSALAGVTSGWAAWLSGLAPATFVSIMFQSTRGLEKRQLKAYGDRPEYRDYLNKVPRLFPWADPGLQ